jgi:ADP-ribose diphosphatase
MAGVTAAGYRIPRLPVNTPASTVLGVKRDGLVQDTDGWETISSQPQFANAHVEVVTDRVQTPLHPKPRSWTVVHRKAAVVIAPITEDGRIVLIRQERIPIRAAIWEMPSGQIDTPREPNEREIKETGLRELREEAGYELAAGGELIDLGYFFSSPGFTDEHGYFLLARPVQPCAGYVRGETESIVSCRGFEVEELRRMIAENEIRDANTLGICARLAARGFISLDSH